VPAPGNPGKGQGSQTAFPRLPRVPHIRQRTHPFYPESHSMATTPKARPEKGEAREHQVRTIFSEIAPRYDLLNHVLSLNIDRRWRRRAVDRLGLSFGAGRAPGRGEAAGVSIPASPRILDACAGTYDLSLELVRRKGFQGRVVASDFARPMLVEGKKKLEGTPVSPVTGDTLRLPFPDAAFDGAMVAFGLRNLADLDRGLREFARVLLPGARLVILEFTTPPNPLVRGGYHFYFHHILPRIGRIVSGHPWAYTYLPESVKEFPGPDGLEARILAAGFADVEWEFVSMGIAAIHTAVR
jgi:demethylmenaquinone methyltransferase / 2-methoxy-6-polyprenyl-1,4-benzoquinol methylase